MDTRNKLTDIANRIRALSQNGLVYAENEYEIERYTELQILSNKILAELSGLNESDIDACFSLESDYVTPKVDVRAVVFNDKEELLFVKEAADGKWSLPGGWADVGYTPSENAVKEVKEETGLDVTPIRILGIYDKSRHNHPPANHYVYKIFILCRIVGGQMNEVFDILDKGFFAEHMLPTLSLERVTTEQVAEMFDYYRNPDRKAYID